MTSEFSLVCSGEKGLDVGEVLGVVLVMSCPNYNVTQKGQERNEDHLFQLGWECQEARRIDPELSASGPKRQWASINKTFAWL